MARYEVVVRQTVVGRFEVEARDRRAARREAEELGRHGWEDPDSGWVLLEEEVEVVRPGCSSAGA